MLVAPVRSPLGYSTNMFLGLALGNSFGTWEGNFAVVSLGPLSGLIIVTGEVSLIVLSLVIKHISPPQSPNLESVIGSFVGSVSRTILVNPYGSLSASSVGIPPGALCVCVNRSPDFAI